MKLLYLTLFLSCFTGSCQLLTSTNNETPNLLNGLEQVEFKDPIPKIISINPNPLEVEVEITISEHELPVTLHIYDVFGRKVRTVEVISGRILLERGKMDSGMYKLILTTADGSIQQKQTLIVE